MSVNSSATAEQDQRMTAVRRTEQTGIISDNAGERSDHGRMKSQ